MKFIKLDCFSRPCFLVSERAVFSSGRELEEVRRALVMLDNSAEIAILSPSVNRDFKISMYNNSSVSLPSYLSGALSAAYYLRELSGLPLAEYEIETEGGAYSVYFENGLYAIKPQKCKRIFTKTEEMPDGVEIKYAVVELDERYAVIECETFPPSENDRLGRMLCRAANARSLVLVLREKREISVYTEAGYASLSDLRAAIAACLSGVISNSGGEYLVMQNGSEARLYFSGGAFFIRHRPRVLHLGSIDL